MYYNMTRFEGGEVEIHLCIGFIIENLLLIYFSRLRSLGLPKDRQWRFMTESVCLAAG